MNLHRIPVAATFAVAALSLAAAPSARAQDLFVSNTGNNNILRITPGGSVSTFASGVSVPFGLAFNSTGNLFVANNNANAISKITPDGQTVTTFVSGGGLNGPYGLAFDGAGNLYVSNASPSTISKITPGGMISLFASGGGMNTPAGIAFDSVGNLYVANVNNTISKITPGGSVSLFASGGSLNNPIGLAFDSLGNLYAANNNNKTISKITSTGTVTTFVTLPSFPEGIAFDSSGNLFAGQDDNTISKVTPGGSISQFVSGGDLNGASLITFGPAVQGGGAAPEPGEWAFYGLAGAGLVGLVISRKTKFYDARRKRA